MENGIFFKQKVLPCVKMGLKKMFILSILVGIVSGLGALLFYTLLDVCTQFFMKLCNLYLPKAGGEPELIEIDVQGNLPIFLITAFGGLISGLIVYTFAPEAEGHGTDAVIRSFHHLRGIVRGRVPIVKIVASAITIGSGGSGGREGPIAQIGAGFGSYIATILNLTDKERRILLVCGMAGGIGSIFRSPLGGAIFSVEVLYKRDYEVEAIIPAFISSIIAYVTFTQTVMLTGFETTSVFVVPDVRIHSILEIPMYAFLGILSAFFAILYVKTFYGVHNIFKRLGIPKYLKPMIGGLVTGLIGLFLPSALGMGYGYVQELIDGKLALTIIILTIFGKIVATSFSIGSGGSGGVFGPSVVIGSFVGGALGYFLYQYYPIQPDAFVLVGMSAFIAGACKTPIAGILMTAEMTGGYNLLPALMLSSAISYLLTRDYTIYSEQVPTRVDSPAHRMEMAIDILEDIPVRDAMTSNVITVSPENTVLDVMHLIEKTGHLGYPVVKDGKLVGIITFTDVEKVPPEDRAKMRVGDVMTPNPIVTYPSEDLRTALEKMVLRGVGRLPVVEDNRLVGIITKGDIVRTYAKVRKKH